MSKKKIITIVAVLFVVGAVGNLFSGGSVSSPEDGEKVARKAAQEIFSGGDIEVSGGGQNELPRIYFEADVGENASDYLLEEASKGENVNGSVDVYVYTAAQRGVGQIVLFVSEDGRVVGMGSSFGSDYYRLR